MRYAIPIMLLASAVWMEGCNTTQHLAEGEYLLRRNNLRIKSDRAITRKGELNDQLKSVIIQKPNKYAFGFIPFKLWLYNIRYKKYRHDTTNFYIKSRTVEKPVVFDSMLLRRSVTNMKGLLFNQGYFYGSVTDTVRFRNRKAYVDYRVETGTNYLIKKTTIDTDNDAVRRYIEETFDKTVLKEGTEFSYSLLEEERSRIAQSLRNNGYYRFSQEFINFKLDTFNKSFFRNIENPFESAINFITLQKQDKKPTLDISIIVRADDEPLAYRQYTIGSITVYPDYIDRNDFSDSSLIQTQLNDVRFRYHKFFVRENVIYKHLYLVKGEMYKQDNYDATISRLNELGIFQYVRVFLTEDTSVKDRNVLRCTILLSPTRRFDYTTNFEVSNGSTYALGGSLSIGFRNRNLFRGANQFAATVSGGIETGYAPAIGDNFLEHFYLLSRNFGVNTNLIIPKFLAPVNSNKVSRLNLPRTIFGLGINVLDRVNYFTLSNTSANFTYNWKETATKTWDVSPAFINILRLPSISDSFRERLSTNQFLSNSYKENFIEGENIAFTFSDQNTPKLKFGYSYVRISLEEAGGVMSGLTALGQAADDNFRFQYAQYVKLDLDARYYLNVRSSVAAFRFYGGLGIPYDKSTVLPYVKQYFVGGPSSIRGWRIRNLGPGGSIPDLTNANFIDRTGDIKLEANAEYRFPIVQLFSGAIKLHGAAFADAGNIWLYNSDPQYPNGEISWSRFGHDIALSTGAGARLDIGSIFILRFDGAIPLKKPYVNRNSGWVLDEINFGSGTWRDQNIIFNVAIGYPF